jgi:hypothetical protein
MNHPGFLVTKEDFRQIEHILNQLADFVSIIHDQSIGEELSDPDSGLLPPQMEDPIQIF